MLCALAGLPADMLLRVLSGTEAPQNANAPQSRRLVLHRNPVVALWRLSHEILADIARKTQGLAQAQVRTRAADHQSIQGRHMQDLSERRGEVARLTAFHSDTIASTSWRVTVPLRGASEMAKRLLSRTDTRPGHED